MFMTGNKLHSQLIFSRYIHAIKLLSLHSTHLVLLAVCTEHISSVFYRFSCPHWFLSDLFHISGRSQCFSTSTNLTYKINLGITETKVMAALEWCVQMQAWPRRVDVK